MNHYQLEVGSIDRGLEALNPAKAAATPTGCGWHLEGHGHQNVC